MRVLLFPCAGKRLALPLPEVREIAEIQGVEVVPGSPRAVAGLADVRGRIVTLLTLDDADPQAPATRRPLLALLLAEPHGHLGLLVRESPSSVQAALLEPEAPDQGDPPLPHPAAPEPGLPAGLDVLVEGGQRAMLINAEALIEFGTRKVRETFKVARDA